MTDHQEIRDDILRRASVGELSDEQAEAEAARHGIGKLASEPDQKDFDPDTLTHWSIVMAVAWIAYRSPDAVRESWDKYCAECWDWIWRRWRIGFDGEVREGWLLEQRSKPTLLGLAIGEAIDRARDNRPPPTMPIRDAEAALWTALRDDVFSASGIDTKTGRRVAIPAIDWHELVAVEGRGEVDEIRYGPIGPGYRDVLVPSKAVRSSWPAPRERQYELPATMPPDGDGYMPLYCAAQWIATKGGTADFDPEDAATWQTAYAALLGAIASDAVRVVGTSGGSREPVPGYHFAGCEICYPFGDHPFELLFSEHLYLRSYPYIDDEHWRGGFDDALMNRWRERWSRLMVAKSDVRERWPFDLAMLGRTGAPGRPTSMHLIFDELERRADRGTIERGVGKEARALVAWLTSEHPMQPRPKPKTVENQIRIRYRELHPK